LNDNGAATLTKVIAQVTTNSVVRTLQNAKFISITCDGCADFTGDDFESVYVRHCTNGVVFDPFLHIGLPNSGCSIDIRDFIMDVFRAAGIESVFNERVIGLCADGASNMQGV
jgi:hypothetical protein